MTTENSGAMHPSLPTTKFLDAESRWMLGVMLSRTGKEIAITGIGVSGIFVFPI